MALVLARWMTLHDEAGKYCVVLAFKMFEPKWSLELHNVDHLELRCCSKEAPPSTKFFAQSNDRISSIPSISEVGR